MQGKVRYDYVIIGHGLAGACLAHCMLERGKKILVLDQPDKNTSSSRAAGLYNPVTGRKMVKTWKADVLFPFLEEFYTRIEHQTQHRFLHRMNIVRPFLSTEEYNDWSGKSADPEYEAFIAEIHGQVPWASLRMRDYGALELKTAGFLDIHTFLEASRERLFAQESYLEGKFDHKSTRLLDDRVEYGNVICDRLIFCEGSYVKSNSYFSWLPMRPVRGEVLELELSDPLSRIFNRGVFILPFRGTCHKAGSTYDHNLLDPIPTEKGKQQILDKLNALINVDYNVTDHYAGIRPATMDRRPIIGMHPEHSRIGIFNGLGTKGVSLAPYFAKEYVEYLENGKELAAEVHINRFLHKFIN